MTGGFSRSFTDAQVDAIARAYRKGATVRELAALYRTSTAPIRNALVMRSVRMRPPAPRRIATRARSSVEQVP